MQSKKEFYNEKNSPVRVALHFDDGQYVTVCGRDQAAEEENPGNPQRLYSYYSPINSQYMYSGANVGIDANGQPITIGNEAFTECEKLSNVVLPGALETMGGSAFSNTGITSINIPSKMESIEGSVFENCAQLKSVSIGENVKRIGHKAFYKCAALEEVVLPDALMEMGSYAFSECKLLKNISFGSGLTTIPDHAFEKCISLEKVVFPYRLQTINANAFSSCTKLKEVYIPRATTSIETNVFSYPGSMTVYGISGTYAETYASSIGAAFVNREVKATSVQLSETAVSLLKGASKTLTIQITPADFTDVVAWKSSDTSVVTVDDAGKIVAKGSGTATIKVTVGSVSASCKVTVLQPVTYIYLNKSNLYLDALETFRLTAEVSPDDANNKEVTWSSEDETIATVSADGVVTGLKKGSTNITATAKDGSNVTGSCSVTVNNNAYICQTVDQLQSPHNYESDCSDVWVYTREGVDSMVVTFDQRTFFEENYDYLYLYDCDGEEIGCYTGSELSGKKITVSGDTIKLKLETDNGGEEWGFAVTGIDVVKLQYNITYVLNGGIQNVNNPGTYKITDARIVLQNPTRNGFVFLGWYSDNAFRNRVTEILPESAADITLYAKWDEATYSISFDGNGATAGSMAQMAGCKYGTEYALPGNTYQRNGYTFGGWNTSKDGKGTAYADKARVKGLSQQDKATVILYAQWTPVTYQISYNLNGGTNNKNNPSQYQVTSPTIVLQTPTRTGYQFMGWYSDAKMSKKVTQISQGSYGNLVLYAKWQLVTYKIKYQLGGGKNNAKNPTKYTMATATIKLKAPTRAGFKFGGWYGDAKYKKKVTQIKKGSTGNVTLYAKWTAISYKITYKLNGGKNNTKNPKKYTALTKTIKLQKPTRSGYTFVAWYSDKKMTKKVTQIKKGTTGNITLYAKWKKK